MKIKLMSDIHLEFPRSKIELTRDDADVLILAGDICTVQNIEKFIPFFEEAAAMFPHVIYVLGNHESYGWHIAGGDDDTGQKTIKDLAHIENLHVLDGWPTEIDGVIFWGGTLWTDCNNNNPLTKLYLDQNMNDYTTITTKSGVPITPDVTRWMHEKYLKWLDDTFKANADWEKKPVVVVSHHAPTMRSIAEKYKSDFHMNGGYASDLSALIDAHPEIKLWCHGHTHTSFDYMEGQTRVLCNPAGYPIRGRDGKLYRENPDFNPQLVVEI